MKMKKQEKCLLIEKLIQDGWFENEKEAIPFIMARRVLVNDQLCFSGKEKIAADGIIRVKEYYKKKYVNKGGLKLEGAIKDFGIKVNDKVALDCGASTGGFTDCLICHGAAKVYAVDAGYGQLAGKLAMNPNVVNMEKTNLGDPKLCELEPRPEIITLDLSYLSLMQALPICKDIFGGEPGLAICLVKPIYEAESPEIKRSGEINDKDVIRSILRTLCRRFAHGQLSVSGITNSPVTGNNGTLEYFLAVRVNEKESAGMIDVDERIEKTIEKSFQIAKFEKNSCTLPGNDWGKGRG